MEVKTEEKQFLESIYYGADQAIFVIDVSPEGEFRYAGLNPAHERVSGFESDWITGRTPDELVPEIPAEAIPAIKKNYQSCLDAGKVVEYEEMIPMKGKNIYWLTRLTPLFDEAGNIYRIIGSATDITKQKARQEQEIQKYSDRLDRQESMYKSFVRNFRGIAFRSRLDRTPVFFHGAVREITGYTEEDFVSGNPGWDQVIHPDDIKRLTENYPPEAFKKPGFTCEREYRIITKEGDTRWVHEYLQTISDKKGKASYLQGSLHDITEWKEIQDVVAETEGRYQSLFENMNDGFAYHKIITDPKGKPVDYEFLDVNDAFCEYTGLERSKVIGNRVTQVMPGFEKTEKDLIGKYGKVALKGETLRFETYVEPFKKWYNISAFSPAKGYFCTLFQDITQRKEFEEKLENNNRQLLALFDGIDDVMYVSDPDSYELLYVNPEMRKNWGDDIIGKKCHKVLQDRDDPCPFCTNDKIFGEYSGKTYTWEFRNEVNKRWYRCADKAIQWSDGRMVRFEIASDITGQKEMEEAIRRSEHRQRILKQVSEIFLKSPDEKMYDQVLELLLKLFQSKFGVFGYIDEAGDLIVPTMTRHIWKNCQVPEKSITFPRSVWIDSCSTWPVAMREQKGSMKNSPSGNIPEGHVPISRHITMPIVHKEKSIGLLQLANKESDYTQEELSQLESIATYIAPILNARLRRELEEKIRRQAEQEVRKHAYDLQERMKEMNCLYELSRLISEGETDFDELFSQVPGLMVKSWQHPEITCARLEYEGKEYLTDNYKKSRTRQQADILVDGKKKGVLEVAYLKKTPVADEGPFLKEERQLIDTMAREIGEAIEKHLAEQGLLASQERYDLVTEATNLGIWDWYPGSEDVFYNREWKRQVGYQPDELENKFSTWAQLLHPEDADRMHKAVNEYLQNPEGLFLAEFRLRHKDGSYRWISNRAASIKDRDGKVVRMFGAHTDITGLKKASDDLDRMNRELKEKNREMEQIVYVTSHDLRSPLVNIEGFSHELQLSLQDLEEMIGRLNISEEERSELLLIISQEMPEAMSFIKTGILKMDKLLKGLLTISRLGRRPLELKQVNMTRLADEVIKAFEFEVKEKEALIRVGKLPQCTADEDQINQVLSNLIQNALKYSGENEECIIEIEGEKKGTQVCYLVRDKGMGIPEDKQEKIFEIFYRNQHHTEGEGLGLTIVKKIIEKHNGTITVESTPGQGSTFTFCLPAKQ